RQLDERPEELAGPAGHKAIGADAGEQLALQAPVLSEEIEVERVLGLERNGRLGQGWQLDVEVGLVDDDGGLEEMPHQKLREDPGRLAKDRRPVELAVGAAATPAVARGLPRRGGAAGLDEELAVAVAADERGGVAAFELLPEGGGESPEVCEERGRVASHERARQNERRHARKAGEPVRGLRLRGARVVHLVRLVNDQEVKEPVAPAQDRLREWDAARRARDAVERLA